MTLSLGMLSRAPTWSLSGVIVTKWPSQRIHSMSGFFVLGKKKTSNKMLDILIVVMSFFIKNNALGLSTLLSALVVTGLHLGALRYYWYWSFWWFDILVHFAGGFLLTFLFLFLYQSISKNIPGIYHSFVFVILFVLTVGLSWELFEVIIESASIAEPDYLLDTIADIFVDIAGALFAYILFLRVPARIDRE